MALTTAAGDDPFLRSITILPVADIEQSAAWYEHALGFETTYLHEGEGESEPTNYAILRRGRLVVHLILDEPLEHGSWTQVGTGKLYLIVRNVDELFEEVRSKGVEIARELHIENWGARAFGLRDPSGNVIGIEQGQDA